MHGFYIYAVTAMLLFCLGLWGLASHKNLLRKIVALNVMAGGVFLLFISIANPDQSGQVDPVPQAMVLTGIVVAISLTAFALFLTRRIHEKTGHAELDTSCSIEDEDG
ncbi:cation:proton antiporter subunit C [Desulfonatronospira sp. MSAO_Bac3]|uniref:sodium:proton antiporter n=1 Tax=Desulfonatronospira sp. MSAO_Bac3 TaxID=2293857 RepID=UPI000FEE8780|nr:cation:proton antiporter subunit C [Desulfonatronospira sp. MSAO_Bac3]RQD73164.1 MAG: Na+/H+ antiporter subunit C [Desulfonatronospira sp. MSAO_Bac3]